MLRRDVLRSAATMVAATGLNETAGLAASGSRASRRSAQYVEARDGTELFVRDWGSGPPIVLVSAWALNSQGWQYQMVRLVKPAIAASPSTAAATDAPAMPAAATTWTRSRTISRA